jgi:small-conductance mechanosensitive channel
MGHSSTLRVCRRAAICLAPALLLAIAAALPASAAAPGAPTAPGAATVPVAAPQPGGQPSAAQITQYLDQTVAWYRGLVVQQEIATDPADLALVADNRAVTDQIVRLGFQFARSAASLLTRQDDADQPQAGPAGQYESLMQLQSRLDKQAQDTQAGLDADRAKLASSADKERQTLQSQIAQLEGQLQLVNARRDAVHTMLEFVSGSTANGVGGSGLRAQIEALAASIGPVAKATPSPVANDAAAAATDHAKATAAPNAASGTAAAAARPEPNNVWDSTARALALSGKVGRIEQLIKQTDALRQASKGVRDPLVNLLRTYSDRGDQLGSQAAGTDPAQLTQQGQQLDALATQFKQVAAPLLPLAEQGVLLDLYEKNLSTWRDATHREYRAAVRELAVRIGVLVLILALVFGGAELWRRAVFRYVHETRRRHQFLLLRRIVLWFVIAIVIFSAFATRLDSFVTFAGLITAGVAVALQNVILSVVGYFLLMGKYGIRVGDRVQIGEVRGEVIEIGLVRLYLMEFGRGSVGPTGRVVAFSNSIVFQPSGGIFKQIPGIHFSWHEITLGLAPHADYGSIRQRLLKAVDVALAKHKDELARQNTEIAQAATSISGNALQPSVRLSFVAAGLEATVRYPVDLRLAAEMDEAVAQELLLELDREPKLTLAAAGEPALKLITDPSG